MDLIETQAMNMEPFVGIPPSYVVLIVLYLLLLLGVIVLTITLIIFLRHLMKYHFKKTDD
ncbi:MAG: hypothetical protein FWC96_08525 [Oscillospiraceae bacterium]|nr:hypothetical protein [Oscillospiraceae bacterium]